MNRLVAIVGPTAVGKSQLALHLAQTFPGEIVSADSRQVYRYMDIGTAKPSPEELSLVRHHLIDIVNPDEDFSLAQYQHLATQAIADIGQRHRLPILVGGSGLYVWAVLEGWQIPAVPPDLEFRRRLEDKAAKIGAERLYQELVKSDSIAAQQIDPRNVRRVIRALEVLKHTDTPLSRQKQALSCPTLIIGLTTDRAELYRRVDSRVDEMVQRGLVEEVKKLMGMGYDLSLPAMSGIGYRQIGQYLKGEMTLEGAIEQIKSESHRLVRHQYNWFRLKDDRIRWFEEKDKSEITAIVTKFRGAKQSGLHQATGCRE
ncbi:MAG TPA: tRNA (adenosine(37)-N6)-dimethylallyltransferase MiaA [Dehalococcoidales bacterium]|nr:tRNA (adenosine(37)-N6)-dimethylallyltransferase MiaA [Dehalococcoidales bacterium]